VITALFTGAPPTKTLFLFGTISNLRLTAKTAALTAAIPVRRFGQPTKAQALDNHKPEVLFSCKPGVCGAPHT